MRKYVKSKTYARVGLALQPGVIVALDRVGKHMKSTSRTETIRRLIFEADANLKGTK